MKKRGLSPLNPLKEALLIGIVGGSGSGKTSIAHELIRRLGQAQVETLLLDMDAYYAPLEVVRGRFGGRPINWDHPHAFDLELMATHLAALKRGQAIRKPVYDFSISDRTGWSEPVLPGRVVVLDAATGRAVFIAAPRCPNLP